MIPLLYRWQNHCGAAHRKNMTLDPFQGGVLGKYENNCLRSCIAATYYRQVNNCFHSENYCLRVLGVLMNTSKSGALGMDVRLARSTGRASRDRMANARVTADEQRELHHAARAEGKALSEWAREILLREARGSKDDAVFTELVATRMLLVNLIKPLILGEKVSPTWITEAMTMVRKEKHKAAQVVMQQYMQDAKER